MNKMATMLVIGIISMVLVATSKPEVSPMQMAIDAAKILYVQKDYIGAQAAYEKILKDYPNESTNQLAGVQYFVGCSLQNQQKSEEARIVFEKIIKDYPTASYTVLGWSQFYIAQILKKQGKLVEANAAAITFVQNYAWQFGASSEQGPVWLAFHLINPKLMSVEDYVKFLENTIKSVKATEENANFLGRVKSELEKMK